jgi:hypothetical protein
MKNLATLVFAGTTVLGIAYTPTTHRKPNPEVAANYLQGHNSRYPYNPYISHKDWNRSEARKQEILSKIRQVRNQIREQHSTMMSADKLINTVASNMKEATRQREYGLVIKKAQLIKSFPADLRESMRMALVTGAKKKLGIINIEL